MGARTRWGVGILGLAALVMLGGCTEQRRTLGVQCQLSSECLDPLVCGFGRCRRSCDIDRDCTPPTHCVIDADADIGVCTLPDEARCALNSECPEGLVCRLTLCTNACNEDVDCPVGTSCNTDTEEGPFCEHAPPSGCVYDSDCERPLVCGDDGRCRFECLLNSDCPSSAQCIERRCVLTDAGPPPPDADAGPPPPVFCAGDAECSNGVFCDGAERCDPSAVDADVDGCLPSAGPPCTAPASCSETRGACVTDCDQDGDGADAPTCGGGDCDDDDATRAPGLPDDCNYVDDDCDGETDEDVDLTADNAHCGLCGNACRFPNATGRCVDSFCALEACFTGFVNLDGLPANGCEVGCGARARCDGLDDDCDGSVDEDPEASASCAAANASAACVAGACALTCNAGFEDCNADALDGCETDLSQPSNCRACGTSCGGGLSCEAGGCEVSPIVDVVAAGSVTCIRRMNGRVACWGENLAGSLGDGTRTPSSVPLTLQGLSNVVGLGGGGVAGTTTPGPSHVCAVDGDDAGVCWGGNVLRQALQPTGPRVMTATLAAGVVAVQVDGGDELTCLRSPTGTVSCVGEGEDGELGDGSGASSETLVSVTGLVGTTDLGLGDRHACVVNADGTVSCWGFNDSGATGDGTSGSANHVRASPVTAVGITGAVAVDGGYQHTCVRHSDGTVSCWGLNNQGQLGDGSTMTRLAAVSPSGISAVEQIALGSDFSCVRHTGGTVSCWGSNSEGQLGDGAGGGSSARSETPVTVPGLSDVTRIAAGSNHACALTSTGEVFCWGRNWGGQVGNGTFDLEILSPVRVVGLP